MVNSRKEGFVSDDEVDSSEKVNPASEEMFQESFDGASQREIETSGIESTGSSSRSLEAGRNSCIGGILTERLRNILRDEGDEDLLIHQNDQEYGVLQWLQALDLQIMGACRADERLRPLLKLNVSSGVAEDRFLAHLSQHFEAPEVGMLARCLCIPLVSIRVGKVVKQGTRLCPTTYRGNLNLLLLPTSDLRISFVGDDGCTERLATLSNNSESSEVVIEEIPADNSGRSFLINLPCGRVLYFWCSEKSKLHGIELLMKMKDLLGRRPSLAQLTGINEARLNNFATHLRTFLTGSTTIIPPSDSSTTLLDSARETSDHNLQLLPASLEQPCFQHSSSEAAKTHSFLQGGLVAKSNSFKDGATRNHGEILLSSFDNLPFPSLSNSEASFANQTETNMLLPEVSAPGSISYLSFPELLGKSAPQIPSSQTPVFSPYYCWCPPSTSSTLHYTVTPQLPSPATESLLPLPSLSSMLSSASSSMVPPKLPLSLADIPSLDFPSYLPDPMVQIPLPVSSFVPMPISQQIPTFIPLMCDPIVHIPIIDICSSGQGYLVSAGPAISTSIPPLHCNQETESMVEKSARETLRLLLSSTQTNPQLMDVLPVCTPFVAGSRGFYSGTRDVNANCTWGDAVTKIKICRRDDDDDDDDEGNENVLEKSGGGGLEGPCCSDEEDKNASLND